MRFGGHKAIAFPLRDVTRVNITDSLGEVKGILGVYFNPLNASQCLAPCYPVGCRPSLKTKPAQKDSKGKGDE